MKFNPYFMNKCTVKDSAGCQKCEPSHLLEDVGLLGASVKQALTLENGPSVKLKV